MNIKKFKLTNDNLDAIHLMQHMVFINISTYKNMNYMDFNDELVRNTFEVLCDKYIRLHESFSIKEWRCLYNEISDSMINKYIIPLDQIVYHLIIEINKSYNDCSRVGIEFSNGSIQPVSIDIFNVQFQSKGDLSNIDRNL
jgi:hypothetical protein